MPTEFNSRPFYTDPFFSVAGTFGGASCRLLWQETAGLMDAGQLQKRPGRWVKWGVLKSVVATRPAPHTGIVVDGVTWRTDGDPLDNGSDWTGEATTDQRKAR